MGALEGSKVLAVCQDPAKSWLRALCAQVAAGLWGRDGDRDRQGLCLLRVRVSAEGGGEVSRTRLGAGAGEPCASQGV